MKRFASVVSALFVIAPLPLATGIGVIAPRQAQAQNCTTFTAPLGDSTNKCASTAFTFANFPGLATNNTWTGDQYFTSGRPWCDIMGKGATSNGTADDDTAAIQACVTQLAGTGGVVFIPVGGFCIKTGPVTSTTIGIEFRGSGMFASTLDACGTNSALIKLDNVRNSVTDITLHGSQSFSANKINLELTSNCGQCRTDHALIYGGSSTIDSSGVDVQINDTVAYKAYGVSMVVVRGVTWFERSQLDHNYPANGTPPIAAPGAWAGTTVYAAGAIVSDAGFYLQATVGGTSGGSLPALAAYDTNITDGTVTWQLLGPTSYYNLQVSNAPEVHMNFTDVTGYASTGIGITGTSSYFKFDNGVFASQLFNSVLASGTGNGVFISNVDSGGCITTGCSTIELNASFGGNAQIINTRIFGVSGFGINIHGGTGNLMTNNVISSPTTAINVDANVGGFVITGNRLLGTTTGVTVAAGTSNNYRIAHNDTTGSGTSISDGGTGTDKAVYANGTGGGSLNAVNGGTGNATLTAHALLLGQGTSPITGVSPVAIGRLLSSQGATSDPAYLASSGTTTTVLHGNASGLPTYAAVSLTADVSGTLPVGNGGTGIASGTSGGVLAFTGSTTITSSAALAANAIVVGGGAGVVPLTQPTTPPTVGSTGITAVINATDATNTTTAALTTAGGIASAKRGFLNNLTVNTMGGNSWGTASTFSQIGLYYAGTLTASGGFARLWQTDVAVTAAANNDELTVLRLTPNYVPGAFTGTTKRTLFCSTSGGGSTADYCLDSDSTGGKLRIQDTTDATSTTTGAFTLAGGFSVNKRVFMNGLSADTASTDNTLCHDTTSHEIKTGTGALGVCLGTSSIRYKHDIAPYSSGLAMIDALEPKTFRYNPGFGDNGARQQFGLLAEDLVKVEPRFVSVDTEGRPNSIDWPNIIWVLVNAAKELKADNDNLSMRLMGLESRR